MTDVVWKRHGTSVVLLWREEIESEVSKMRSRASRRSSGMTSSHDLAALIYTHYVILCWNFLVSADKRISSPTGPAALSSVSRWQHAGWCRWLGVGRPYRVRSIAVTNGQHWFGRRRFVLSITETLLGIRFCWKDSRTAWLHDGMASHWPTLYKVVWKSSHFSSVSKKQGNDSGVRSK